MNCVRRREGARKIWGVLRGEAILQPATVHVTFLENGQFPVRLEKNRSNRELLLAREEYYREESFKSYIQNLLKKT